MKKWILKNKCANYQQLANIMDINPIIAKVATNRGMISPELLEHYLNPTIESMHDPMLLEGMTQAIDLIKHSIANNHKISIVGDYDVDGIMSTTILLKGIKRFTENVDTYIPDRVLDGYGINENIVETLYISGTKLIITCDNGVSAFEAISKAKELGMFVIVLDHHEFKSSLDENGNIKIEYVLADAIVDPQNPKCSYPFKKICGAVVCYKFIESLYKSFSEKFDYEKYIIYGAFATVCDVVDLVDENRCILKEGLRLLNLNKPLGIEALCKAAKIETKLITAYDFGYILGPCLNASGRLENASLALELMVTNSIEQANILASTLVNLNQERKELTDVGMRLASEKIKDLNPGPIKVIYLESVHESIAGIIAGRMKEKLYTPFIVLTNSNEGYLKGSARSVDSINIIEEIARCKDNLRSFGGHPMAAGLSLEPNELDDFIKNVNANLLHYVPEKNILVDMMVGFEEISLKLHEELLLLEPFGKNNEKPAFAQTKVNVESYREIGKNGQFMKLKLSDKSKTKVEALYFGNEKDELLTLIKKVDKKMLDIIFSISSNEYQGNVTLQIIIQEFRESL